MTYKIGAALAAAILIAGCNVSRQANADGSKTIKVGDTTMNVGAAPKNMPAYAPLYADAKIVSSIENGAANPGGMVVFTVQDKPDVVMAFYKKVAADNKLTQVLGGVPSPDGSEAAMISEPGTKRQLDVTAGPNTDGTSGTKVSLSWTVP